MCSIYGTHFRRWLMLSHSRPLPENGVYRSLFGPRSGIWEVQLLTTTPVGVHWDNCSLRGSLFVLRSIVPE